MDKKTLRLAIASDHAGFDLKEELRKALVSECGTMHDFGTYSRDSVDYPDFAEQVALSIVHGEQDLGILVCGTGIGMAISANKISGIRAGACSEPYSAIMSRAHNNANILAIGSRVVGVGLAIEIALSFLETDFESGSRHEQRVRKISDLETRWLDPSADGGKEVKC